MYVYQSFNVEFKTIDSFIFPMIVHKLDTDTVYPHL